MEDFDCSKCINLGGHGECHVNLTKFYWEVSITYHNTLLLLLLEQFFVVVDYEHLWPTNFGWLSGKHIQCKLCTGYPNDL